MHRDIWAEKRLKQAKLANQAARANDRWFIALIITGLASYILATAL